MPLLLVLLAVHVLAAMFWVGGMAFALTVLRPAAGGLEPAVRLSLWRQVFSRFLPWVGVSIVALLVSGYAMLFLHFGGFRGAGVHVHVMHALGLVMVGLFLHLFFAPWRRFRAALDQGALPEAARNLDGIRRLVAANLILGLATVVVGATGRYW